MVFGTLAGIGASLFGASQASKAARAANRSNIAAKNAARRDIVAGRDAYMRQSDMGLAQYLDMLAEAGIGEARAAGEISRGTRAAAQGIMDADAQGMGALAGNFANAGLFGSSLLSQARMGQRRSTGRALTDLEGSAAMQRASLARGASAARMGALGAIGGAYERRGQTLYDAGRSLAGLEAGVQHVVDPGMAGAYGQLGGMLAGLDIKRGGTTRTTRNADGSWSTTSEGATSPLEDVWRWMTGGGN